MEAPPVRIDEALVRALVADQFPAWAHLPVRAVPRSGWDNRTFRLGDDMLVRVPSAPGYAAQVHREQRWLPWLRPHLPLEIPQPLALGRPGPGCPWSWSVYRWIAGAAAAEALPGDLDRFAADLAAFLNALRAAPAEDGPPPGPDNFHRGAALTVYDGEFRRAVDALGGRIDRAAALAVWDAALATTWDRAPVWVHGDIALGNLIVRDGRLAAVIDFGQVCIGDPACDLAIAWTFFAAPQRQALRASLALDTPTWQRGGAWALWKAVIVAAGLVDTNAAEGRSAQRTIDAVLSDPLGTGA